MNSKIMKWGNSQGIRIPKGIVDSLNLKLNDEIEIEVEGESIIIKKKDKKKTIVELFENYNGDYETKEFDFGNSVGKEEW